MFPKGREKLIRLYIMRYAWCYVVEIFLAQPLVCSVEELHRSFFEIGFELCGSLVQMNFWRKLLVVRNEYVSEAEHPCYNFYPLQENK
jgi:hypothetical protein